MQHSVYMTYEVKILDCPIVVDAFGTFDDETAKAYEKLIHRIEEMIRSSYSGAKIELKRSMIKDS